jgi:hypothetical protein
MIHLKTTNKSFLEVAQQLEALGIKNNAFMLRLDNPELEKVNPYRLDMPSPMMDKILEECKNNFWYFIREVVRIPVKGTDDSIQFVLNRASAAVFWCMGQDLGTFDCSARLTHKTHNGLMPLVYSALFADKEYRYIFAADNKNRSKENHSTFLKIIEKLPDWMRDHLVSKIEAVQNPETQQRVITTATFHSPSHVDSFMRVNDVPADLSKTVTFFDEWEHTPFNGELLECLIYGNHTICSSTPGDTSTSWGNKAQDLINTVPRFSETMYDQTGYRKDDCWNTKFVYIEFNYQELGFDTDWLKNQYEQALSLGLVDEFDRSFQLIRNRANLKPNKPNNVEWVDEFYKSDNDELTIKEFREKFVDKK